MSKPLEGLRVLDCSLGTAGPQATGLLADYGADVTWFEPPGGDPTRSRAPAAASVFNRGKRSAVLDVTAKADRDRIVELAKRADVFVEAWQPGEATRLGLGFEQLHAVNPQLIYCSISGFGADDPRRDLPPYEALVHALLGSMEMQPGHREGPVFLGLPFATTGAAQLAVIGILSALYRRMEDGVGRQVETSLVDGALAFHSMFWGESDKSLKEAAKASPSDGLRGGSTVRLITRAFACADGEFLGIHTGAVGAFDRLMKVLGLSEQIPPLTSGFDMGTALTPEQRELLENTIHGVFASQPRDYWVKHMMEVDICAVEHQKATTVFDTPQAKHNGMTITVNDPVLGAVEQVSPGIRLNGKAPGPPAPAPRTGQDTQAVLDALEKADQGSPWQPKKSGSSGADTRPLLDGVNILDVGAYYAGPYSSRLLADLGADVIKLETVIGDSLRGIERPFFSAQAGKRAIAANLKDANLAPAVKKILEWAHIVHHNMRPGAAERLNLGADQVRETNPDTIYLFAPGWGSTGPFSKRQSFAPLLSGYVGVSYELAGEYNEPMPSGTANEDPGNGLLGAIGMLIALLHKRRTGETLSCENPQLNAAMGMMAHVVRTADGEALGAGNLDVLQMGISALESLYETSDGWICLAARENDEIQGIENVMGVSILGDERFATFESRAEHRAELADVLRDAFATRSTIDWQTAFENSGAAVAVPAGGTCIHDLLNDPDQHKIRRVEEATHPDKGNVREIAHLIRVSDTTMPPHRLAPELGEHTDEILTSVGYSAEEIKELRARKSIR